MLTLVLSPASWRGRGVQQRRIHCVSAPKLSATPDMPAPPLQKGVQWIVLAAAQILHKRFCTFCSTLIAFSSSVATLFAKNNVRSAAIISNTAISHTSRQQKLPLHPLFWTLRYAPSATSGTGAKSTRGQGKRYSHPSTANSKSDYTCHVRPADTHLDGVSGKLTLFNKAVHQELQELVHSERLSRVVFASVCTLEVALNPGGLGGRAFHAWAEVKHQKDMLSILTRRQKRATRKSEKGLYSKCRAACVLTIGDLIHSRVGHKIL